MKANEAPEKLYISDSELNDAEHCVIWFKSQQNKNDIEYTRTDAFIKKAENFLEMLGYGFTITDNITHKNYDKEQLIKDFKNYMKGE